MGAADVVRRQAEAQNKGDFDAVIDLFTEDVVWSDPQGRVDGRDGARSRYSNLYAAFPDGTVELGRVVEQGDICMYEETFRGTNTGDLALPDGTSVTATGKPFSVDAIAVVRVDGDLIADYRIVWDQLAAMMSLGVMPPPG
jgi:ketosteroid isomerase-like protein